MVNIQRLSSDVLNKVLEGRSLTDVLNTTLMRYSELSTQERAMVQDLSYGSLRYLGEIEALLDLLLTKPLQSLPLRRLLIVALYQLRYTRAAPYAVVDHAVTTSVAISRPARGLVNAVLRAYLRKHQELSRRAWCNEVGRYSYPQWWVDKLKEQYPEDFPDILLAGNQRPPMCLRINQRQADVVSYGNRLEELGMAFQKIGDEAILLAHPVPVNSLPGFREGLVSVQDRGAQFAAHFLDLWPGQRVLDACAAPGGKTAHILECADVEVLALDCDETRLGRAEQNLSRLGLTATVVCGDAAIPENWWNGIVFDRILVDVPCTASGVVRRHPDIKWLRRESDIAPTANKQGKILDALWRTLASGGKLLYSTCSLFREENQLQIAKFVEQNRDASLVALGDDSKITVQLLPQNEHDGFFYALLQKK